MRHLEWTFEIRQLDLYVLTYDNYTISTYLHVLWQPYNLSEKSHNVILNAKTIIQSAQYGNFMDNGPEKREIFTSIIGYPKVNTLEKISFKQIIV